METYNQPDTNSAYEAIFEAQKIAFGPFVFQATRALLKTGILKTIEDKKGEGCTIEYLAKTCDVSPYGVSVLLDMGLSAKIVWYNQDTESYVLNKIGHFLLNDKMTEVNFNFAADVNYRGMEKLLDSIIQGEPVGLKEFTETESTIYPYLSQLPPDAKKSWFEFDHFYSDQSFSRALEKVFNDLQPKVIMDIGGNTGKWAIQCLKRDPNVKVVIADLPGQLNEAKKNIEKLGLLSRVDFIECDILNEELPQRDDVDMVWLSQFLDCFSQEQIENIMTKVKNSTPDSTNILILEPFWDLQQHEAQAFVLNATSLYFTALANGKSRMYNSKVFIQLLNKCGLEVFDQTNHIAVGGHSLLCCRSHSD